MRAGVDRCDAPEDRARVPERTITVRVIRRRAGAAAIRVVAIVTLGVLLR